MNNRLLQVFAKAPIRGFVKTRLITELGEKAATDVYVELLEHTLQVALSGHFKVQIWCAPSQQHEFFQRYAAEEEVSLKDQSNWGLGERMLFALKQGLEEHDEVVLIGADCPVITAEYLTRAFEALGSSDVVLGPAEDGGFVLIACRKMDAEMFDGVSWGCSTVLEQTLDALARAEFSHQLLPMLWDVDTPADVRRWRQG